MVYPFDGCMRDQCRFFWKLKFSSCICCHLTFYHLYLYPSRFQSYLPDCSFVMCIACLAGTALIIFKKSRDKPAGYALLVSGGKK